MLVIGTDAQLDKKPSINSTTRHRACLIKVNQSKS